MKIIQIQIISEIFFPILLGVSVNSHLFAQDQFLSKNNVNSNQQRPIDPMKRTDSEWKRVLSQEEYRILREKGTERAYTGKYDGLFEEGLICAPVVEINYLNLVQNTDLAADGLLFMMPFRNL